MDNSYKIYPHNPPHLFLSNAIYMVTGSILSKKPLLDTPKKKLLACQTLFERSARLGWQLQAWSVLHNHYHFIALAPENALSLIKLVREYHSITAHQLNQLDQTPGRQVWHNYWDTCITYEKSYLARLHYIHMNPVKHGLVQSAEDYPFCSYRWFLEQGEDNFKLQVFSQPFEQANIMDDF
jgi:putative transposase